MSLQNISLYEEIGYGLIWYVGCKEKINGSTITGKYSSCKLLEDGITTFSCTKLKCLGDVMTIFFDAWIQESLSEGEGRQA